MNERLPLGVDGGCAGLAAAEAEAVVVEDLSRTRRPSATGGPRPRRASAASGRRRSSGPTACSAPCPASPPSVGRPEPAQLELARLYLGYVASAIERERLLSEVSRRNRILESLRGMLETLAGPDRVEGGLGACRCWR